MRLRLFNLFSVLLLVLVFSPRFNYVRAEVYNDWPIFQMDPQHTGYNSAETALKPPLTPIWTLQVANGALVVSGNTLYSKDSSGILYSIDSSSGTINWQVQTQAVGELAVANNIVYAVNFNTSIDAFDASTGQKIWSNPFPAYGITVVGNVVYAGSLNDTVSAMDATTGNPIWGAKLADGVYATPAVVNGKVFIGTYQKAFYALDAATGTMLWKGCGGCGNYPSSPTVENNIAYVGNASGGWLDAYDGSTGYQIWSYKTRANTNIWAPISYANNILYTQDVHGTVYAFDANTSNILWTYNSGAPGETSSTAVVIANGVVYQGSTGNTLNALDAQTGTLLWQYTTGPIARVIVANHMLFVSSTNGIYAFTTDIPPVINPIQNATINEGDTYTTSGSFTDPDSSSWTATVDYGDGSGVQPLGLSGTNFLLNHVCQNSGIYTVTVKVTDNQGATGTGTATVTVNNVAPTVNTPSVSPEPSYVGQSATASATFSDPGINDSFTCIVNYGDGSGNLTGTVNNYTCTGPAHTYTMNGSYTVSISVTDKDNGTGSATTTHVVNAAADVGVTMTALPYPVRVNHKLTYTITISNNGPSTATNVTMSDTLPKGVTIVSVKTSQGSCGGTRTIICNLGILNNGNNATVTIIVIPKHIGTISNTASVTANEYDPNPSNNTYTLKTRVIKQ